MRIRGRIRVPKAVTKRYGGGLLWKKGASFNETHKLRSIKEIRATHAFHKSLDKSKQQSRVRKDYGKHVGIVKHHQEQERLRRTRGKRFQRTMRRDITGKRYEW
jgi:hypothetical protein